MPNNGPAAFNDPTFQTVYRVDARHWDEIFAQGFNARAPDARVDLADYVDQNQDSPYISTTVSPYAALAFSGAGTKRLYKIVTNRPRKSVRDFTLPNKFSHQDEVAVIDYIPAAHVAWCKEITLIGREEIEVDPQTVPPHVNPGFIGVGAA